MDFENYKEENRVLRSKLYDSEEEVAKLQTALALAKETLKKSEDEKADLREELEEVKRENEARREKIDELAISAISCDSERQNLAVELQEVKAAADLKVAETQAAAEAKVVEVKAAAEAKVVEVKAAAEAKVAEARFATRTQVIAEFRAASPVSNVKEIYLMNQLSKAKANLETSLQIIKSYQAVLEKYAAMEPRVVAAEFFEEVIKLMEKARASGEAPFKFSFQKDALAVLEEGAALHRAMTEPNLLLPVPAPAMLPQSPSGNLHAAGPSTPPEITVTPPGEDTVVVADLIDLGDGQEGDQHNVDCKASADVEGGQARKKAGTKENKGAGAEQPPPVPLPLRPPSPRLQAQGGRSAVEAKMTAPAANTDTMQRVALKEELPGDEPSPGRDHLRPF